MSGLLSLGELGRATSGFEAVFLSFLHSGVTSQEASLLKDGPQFRIILEESTGKAVTDSASLTSNATTCNGADDVELTLGLGESQGLTNDELKSIEAEVFVDAPVVDGDVTGTLVHSYPGNRAFSSTGAVKIRFGIVHLKSLPSQIKTRILQASEQHGYAQHLCIPADGEQPHGR